MSITLKALNNLVTSFLQEHGGSSDDLEKLWMMASTQKKVKSIIAKMNKPPKDKNAPRRGKSAYLFFCEKYRGEVKEDLGVAAKATDVTSELGVRWNALKDDLDRGEELEELMVLAEEDRERYETEKANYTPPDTATISAAKTGPKRPQSAYLFFCAAFRQEIKQEMIDDGEQPKATDVTKELGRRWNDLKAEEGEGEFVKLAEADKTRYFEEKASGVTAPTAKKAAPKKAAPKKAAPKKAAPKKKVATKKAAPKKATKKK